ncbi:ABC transporter permease [Hymenobacter busanensis]|uniref:ABC transporter permease n=1 Tax=Hymenobacter busanensis TaxID=2607656 RepID=UPI0013673189|nr:ABC transporter permease [Hymenobacter busanensis]QHJ09085.1 ABC transporter permease subunit [Hymenobacter busanensis]
MWLVISIIFLLSHSLPRVALQSEDTGLRTGFLPERAAAELRYQRRLGLDQPVFYFRLAPWHWHGTTNQYHRWLTDLLRGDLGASYRDGRPSTAVLRETVGVTLPLVSLAFIGCTFLSINLALAMAMWPRVRSGMLVLLHGLEALPLFVLGLLLLLLLANPDALALFPAYGLGSADLQELTWLQRLPYLVLPVSSLVLVNLPALVLTLDAALQQSRVQPYMTTARAKGASIAGVWIRHALPNALLPFLTRLTDLLPALVGGAVVIEVLFALPGLGRLLLAAGATRDYPVLLGGVLMAAVVRLVSWLLADLLQAVADPRTRTSK